MDNKSFIVLFTNPFRLLFLLTEGKTSKSNKSHYEPVCLPVGLYDSSWVNEISSRSRALLSLGCQNKSCMSHGCGRSFHYASGYKLSICAIGFSVMKMFLCPRCTQLCYFGGIWRKDGHNLNIWRDTCMWGCYIQSTAVQSYRYFCTQAQLQSELH